MMPDKADHSQPCAGGGGSPMKDEPGRRDGVLRRLWSALLQIVIRTPQLDRTHATDRDTQMMRRAIEAAHAAWDHREVPIGAVVYHNETSQILAEAHNLRESDADPTAHAEILVLREAARKLGSWRLNDCTLVVTLEPCTMCAGAIVNARVGRVVYGATDPKAGAVESLYQICDDRRLNHRPQIIRGVLAPQCRNLLREFFKERRKQNRINKAVKHAEQPPRTD